MNVQQILNKISPKLNSGLYDSVWPLYFVCRTIGLSNFKMELRENNVCSFTVDKITIARSALQYLVLSIITSYNCYEMYKTDEFRVSFNEYRFKVGFLVYTVSQTLLTVNIYVGILFTSQNVWLLNQISKMDEDFKLLEVQIDHRYLNEEQIILIELKSADFRKIWWWSVCGVILSISIVAVEEFYEISTKFEFPESVYSVVDRAITTLFDLVNLMVVFQYGTYAMIIMARYKALNKFLKYTLCEYKNKKSGKSARCPLNIVTTAIDLIYICILTNFLKIILQIQIMSDPFGLDDW